MASRPLGACVSVKMDCGSIDLSCMENVLDFVLCISAYLWENQELSFT